jgi:membrane-bound lytic murein transglycosylase MltF
MATKGCDPEKWFGNVEKTSLKAKTAVKGYGQSFYQINRGYVRSIWFDRRQRYTFMDTK